MGVKSTHRLTREDAIDLFCELKAKRKRRKWEAQATVMSDGALELLLEEWNDKIHGGEGFTNYSIVRKEYV